MSTGSLYLDYYDSVSISGSTIYAVIFNRSNQAARYNGSAYVLNGSDVAFVNSDQPTCAIQLNLDRMHHYSVNLLASAITLPSNLDGDAYTIEYWKTSGSPSRSLDVLLSNSIFYWDGIASSEQRLSLTERNTIASLVTSVFGSAYDSILSNIASAIAVLPSISDFEDATGFGIAGQTLSDSLVALQSSILSRATHTYVCQLTTAFDSLNGRVTHKAWLECDGQLQTNVVSCTINWIDNVGASLYSGNSVTPSNGFFSFQQTGVVLTPDLATTATVTIVDIDGNVYTTACGIVPWD